MALCCNFYSASLDQLDRDGALTHRRHVELNASFHQTLIAAAANGLLAGVYHGIQMQLLGAWVQRGREEWRLRLASESQEHHAIIAGLRERDAGKLTAALRQHLQRSLNGALRDIAARPQPTPNNARRQAGAHMKGGLPT